MSWTAEEKERARYHLNRRRGAVRPKPEPQTEALFPEPKHQTRQWVPFSQDDGLFTEPPPQDRRLVPVEGWRDYRADGGGGDDGAA
jgi:hypothetical protein